MKISKKTLGTFLGFIFLGLIVGTIIWEILELLISGIANNVISITTKPLGFDLGAIAFFIRLNPGSLVGLIGGWILFSKI